MIWRQILGYIPVNLASIIVSFGTIAILTRVFDDAEFGRYALAIATMHFVHMTLFTWIEAAVSRYYARAERNGKVATHLKTSYMVAFGLAILFLPIFLIVIFALPLTPLMKTLIGYTLVSTCITLIYNIGIEAHKAAHRIKRFSALQTSQSLLGFSVGIALILLTPLRETAPFVGIIVGNIFAIAIDLPFMLRVTRGGAFDFARAKRYFAYGVPISLSLFLTYILSQGDLFLISYFLGDGAVGKYNAGYNLANRSLDVLFIWIAMAATPVAITMLEKDGVEKTKEVLGNYGATLLLIILPAATGIALVAEPAGFILGESVRAEAVTIMPLVAFAGVFNGFISYYAHRAFMLSQRTGILAITMIVPVVVNVALNIILIPKFGLMGAVWATVFAYGLGLLLSILVARRYFPLPIPYMALFKVSIACLIMAIGVITLPDSIDRLPDVLELILKASVGAIIYGVTALALNAANCRALLLGTLAKFKHRLPSETVET